MVRIPVDISWRIKHLAEKNLGIRSSSVILNASHTHCGPVTTVDTKYPKWNVNLQYVENLEASIFNGILNAIADLKPSVIKYGMFISDLGIDRRLPKLDKDGKMFWGWGPYEEGYYDPDMSVVAVYDEKAERLKGVMYSYGCHPTARGGQNISADFPGAVSRGLKKNLGENVVTLFAQGAGGNIKPRIYDRGKKSFKTPSVEELEAFGKRYADDITEYLLSGKMNEIALEIHSGEKEFDIPFDLSRVPDEQTLWEYHSKPVTNYQSIAQKMWARNLLEQKRTNSIPENLAIHFTRISLGNNVQIIGMSSEIVAPLGRMVKDLYPDKNTIFLGYCTYVRPYIPTSKIVEEGGYEGEDSMIYCLFPAPFVKDIDSIIKKEVLSLNL